MRKRFLKTCCLTVAACAFLLGGCRSEDRGVPTLTGTEPIVPETTVQPHPGNQEVASYDSVQLRLYGKPAGWWNSFKNGNSFFFVAENQQNLKGQLTKCGINPDKLDLSAYDDVFFEGNCLVVIPRTSNSGSVHYQPRIEKTDDSLIIKVEAKMPQIGTADMADFLLLVPVSRSEIRQGMTVTVDPEGNPQGKSNLQIS